MIIEKICIKKFRGFQDVGFHLGSQITVIAGQNGTQKTTLLGLLSQPFSISLQGNPMKAEKPLCGGSFKSDFSEKFKLSDTFDKVKTHEWELYFHNENLINNKKNPFIIESIDRNKNKDEGIRFWRKGDKSAGSGYVQLPVIYLSLKRLFPIGEDNTISESQDVILTENEYAIYKEWHNRILIISETINEVHFLSSKYKNKDTLGVNTASYDWKSNSAGQDNIGKILLAILSFRRLKEKYEDDYKGGILAIDELDATLYPASQIKLLEALRKFSSNYNIQIIFTSHSLPILQKACETQKNNINIPAAKNQINVVYLEKKDNIIHIYENVPFDTINHRINVIDKGKSVSKINVFTEDKEAAIFAKALLKRTASKLNFIDCSLSCSSLIDLPIRKIPNFTFPNSIIFLDGDVKNDSKVMTRIKKIKNIVVLPSKLSPERIIAEYLFKQSDNSNIWESIALHHNKQVCFRDYTIEDIGKHREKAKEWFKSHYRKWGTNASKVINPWMKDNPEEVNKFIDSFKEVYNKFAKELSIDEIN